MPGTAPRFLLVLAFLALATLTTCGKDSPTKPAPAEPPPPPVPSRITITPSSVTLNAVGQTDTLIAKIYDQYNAVLGSAAVIWSSGNPAVATVSSQGLVTATGNGTTAITARSGSVVSEVPVSVMQEAARIVIDPDEATPLSIGETLQLTAAVLDGNDQPLDGAVVTWHSNDASVATVGAQGLVTAVGKGSASITALSGSISSSLPVSVLSPDDQVSIPDRNLRSILENRLGKAPGSPIYEHEMLTLISLDARYINDRIWVTITSLEGIQFAANLEELQITGNDIHVDETLDLTPVSSLTRLRRLNLSGVNNVVNPSPLDLSPLEGLSNLSWLDISANNVTDLSHLSRLTNLNWLSFSQNRVSDISPLANLKSLRYLAGVENGISDVSSLVELAQLGELYLNVNNITDLGPLVTNAGLDSGDLIDVRSNPLNAESINTHIPALLARGVRVSYDDVLVVSDPRIYNDNLFVLPVSEKLSAGILNLPIRQYAATFYEHFDDEFDFLMFISNIDAHKIQPGGIRGAYFSDVMNEVEGIGKPILSNHDWGSPGQLQGVVVFSSRSFHPINQPDGRSILREGPTLHEIMHKWANFVVPSTTGPHWGFSSANGILGGFNIIDLVDFGEGKYSAGDFAPFGLSANVMPYSPIELYLAGFIGPEEVPDLWVAEDGEWLVDDEGLIVRDENRHWVFTANQVETYTIDDIILEHGERDPPVSQSQKDFRAAAILLVDRENPATAEFLEILSRDVSWFSHAGDDGDPNDFNFYEATGGRGRFIMEGLSQHKMNAENAENTFRGY